MSKKKKGRGRPLKYTGNLRKHLESLVRKNGLSGARAILNADENSSQAAKRNQKLVPSPLGVSMATLSKIAKTAGISLNRGRPKGSTKS